MVHEDIILFFVVKGDMYSFSFGYLKKAGCVGDAVMVAAVVTAHVKVAVVIV